jgi:hypothetical protein
MNNVAALVVGRVVPVTVIGEDGEGYELRQALQAQGVVDLRHLYSGAGRRTPRMRTVLPLARPAGNNVSVVATTRDV